MLIPPNPIKMNKLNMCEQVEQMLKVLKMFKILGTDILSNWKQQVKAKKTRIRNHKKEI